ncbi:MAG: carboxypeptidase-like regulatory domain-containing protein, partial [Muribaculaceae bacterium]|nr:carboxypeptidase-like regulatory domain-containing protein [Muribaculaceae bacterium]
MRTILAILHCILGVLIISASTTDELCGTVTDSATGEPVAGAIVKSRKTFTTTDTNGYFSLKSETGVDSVSFRCMGYETLTLPSKADLSDVRLLSKTTQLR